LSTFISAGFPLIATLAIIIAGAAAYAGYSIGTRHARATGPQQRFHDPALAQQHREGLASRLQDLETISVNDIMIPRSEIAWIDISDDWDTILDQLRTTPHTRLPVCNGHIDNVAGILHMKKVAHALVRGDFGREALEALAREREAYFVPEATALNVQLLNFQRDRRRIALVVDEYGDIQGLVTLEDIFEEIVGEFTSAPATLHQDVHRDSDGSYVVNAAVNTRVLNRTLGWSLPTNGPRTLNGLIVEYLETIPEPGTSLILGDLSVEILQTSDNSVKTARIRPCGQAGEVRRTDGAMA
jgi:Mg2+/Co2+ transporter CorB